MAGNDRFRRLYELPRNQYRAGSPLLLQAGALLLDQQTNRCIVQLKFSNVSDQIVTGIKVRVECLDMEGLSLGVTEASYPDLSCAPGAVTGDRVPIFLSHNDTRSVRVWVSTVVTANGIVWKNDAPFEKLPGQSEHTLSSDALEEYRQEVHERGMKNSALCPVQEAQGLWQCGCTAWNGAHAAMCAQCGLERSWQQEHYQENELLRRLAERRIRDAERIAREAEEARLKAEREEKERLAREKADLARREAMRKRNRKMAVVGGAAAAVLCIVLLVTQVFVPNSRKKKAEELINQDLYQEAWDMYLLADNEDAYYLWRTALINRAAALKTEQQYGQAARAYEEADLAKKAAGCRYLEALQLAENLAFDEAYAILDAMDTLAQNDKGQIPDDIRKQVHVLRALELARNKAFDEAYAVLDLSDEAGEDQRSVIIRQHAEHLTETGDYQGAVEVLGQLPAEERAEQENSIRYAWASACEEQGDYQGAVSALQALTDEEAAEKMDQLRFDWAAKAEENGDFDGALQALSKIQGHVEERVAREKELRLTWAGQLEAAGDYQGAVSALMGLRDDGEVAQRYREVRYAWARACVEAEDYPGALNALLTLMDEETAFWRMDIQRMLVYQLEGEGDYEQALRIAENIADQGESARVAAAVRVNWAHALYAQAQYEKALDQLQGLTGEENDALRSAIAADWEATVLSEGNYSAAKRMYTYLGKDQLAAYYGGRALENSGKLEEAAAQYKLAGDVLDAREREKNVWYAPLYKVNKGKTVYYGHKKGSMLAWKVLDVQSGKALLLCEDVFGPMSHIKKDEDYSVDEAYDWSYSIVRSYLNEYFLENHLTLEERQLVLDVVLDNGDQQSTWDKVFVLSEGEVDQYGVNKKFIPAGDEYAVDWWLRNRKWAGLYADMVAISAAGGYFDDDDCVYENYVRPAMWITLPKDGEDLQDTADRIMKEDYDAGVAFMASGDYQKAADSFVKVLSYGDAAALHTQCYATLAEKAMQKGNYSKAAICYRTAGMREEMHAALGYDALYTDLDQAKAWFCFALAGDAYGAKERLQVLQQQMLDDAEVGDTVFLGHAVADTTTIVVPLNGELQIRDVMEKAEADTYPVAVNGSDLVYSYYSSFYVKDLEDVRGKLDYIPWVVIGEDQNTLTLISKNALTERAYHHTWENVDYADSDIHAYLNGEFSDQAFSEGEKRLLQPGTEVMLPSMQEFMQLREVNYSNMGYGMNALTRTAGANSDFIQIYDGYGTYLMESGEMSAVPEVYVNTEGNVFAVIQVQKSEMDPTPVPTAEPPPEPAPEQEHEPEVGALSVPEGDASQPLTYQYAEDGQGIWQCNGEALWINKQVLAETGFEVPVSGDETISLILLMQEWGVQPFFGAENADDLLKAFRAYFEATAGAENVEGYMLHLTSAVERMGVEDENMTAAVIFLTVDPVNLPMESYEPLILFFSHDEFPDTQVDASEPAEEAAAPSLSDAQRSEYMDKLTLMVAAGMTDDAEFKNIYNMDPEYFAMVFAEMGLEIPD